MNERQIRMLDTENSAIDTLNLCKSVLVELNAGDIEKAKSILKKYIETIEKDFAIDTDSDKIIELDSLANQSSSN